jgi:hypothetical protein
MTIMPCTCSRACQADSSCDGLPCFQAYLDAARDAHHLRTHMRAVACASHFGVMVVAMAAWARDQGLAEARLTILTIEPPSRETCARQQSHHTCAQTSGLVFSTIHLGESLGLPSDTASYASGTHHSATWMADQLLRPTFRIFGTHTLQRRHA